MRLLVVSNYYPPHHIGGYELGCAEVVDRLRRRGHAVRVLTSTFRGDGVESHEGAERSLPLAAKQKPPALKSAAVLVAAARRFRPDVVYFWNLAGLSFWLPLAARMLRLPRLFFISDGSFVAWRIGAFARRWFKEVETGEGQYSTHLAAALADSVLIHGRMVTAGENCEFASEFLRRLSGVNPVARPRCASVVQWGIDLERFQSADAPPPPAPLKLLFVGQIIPEKGVHTAIDAVSLLVRDLGLRAVTLTIVGGSSKPYYLAAQRAKVAEEGLEEVISFAGKMPREALPQLYRAHHVLLFPSIWDEPFAITPLEAMSSGVLVVGTSTGGSAEIFRDRDNSLVFPAGDAEACSAAVLELYRDRELFCRVQRNALELVREHYSIERMVDQIEQDLEAAIR